MLIKNRIKLPVNLSSDIATAKSEIRENSIRNIYLSLCFILFIGCMIAARPYIKNIVNEVKFTYVAEEYKTNKVVKKEKKLKTKTEKKETEFKPQYDNTVSLNAETTINLFEDLDYDLKSVSRCH